MIVLTRPNGQPVMLNCDVIESVEDGPETILTLTSGHTLIVRERSQEIEQKVVAFKRKIYGPRQGS